jgi:hypothetical protein
MKVKTAKTAMIEVELPRSRKAMAKRWTVTFVDRPRHEDEEFLTENEVWARASRLSPFLLVEKVEPKK